MDNIFFETLKVEDGHFVRAERHIGRMLDTLTEVGCRCGDLPNFKDDSISADMRTGVVKCRCIYGASGSEVQFEPYIPRSVRSLKVVDGGDVDYHLKYADRSRLAELAAMRGECDDVLIMRNGRITDTSYSNVAFFDGRRYVVPEDFLLNGLQRRYLLETGIVTEEPLTVADFPRFRKVFLINAMLDLDYSVSLPIENIVTDGYDTISL